MSRSVQQNFLQIQPDGSVSASFPGGVIIPTFDQSVGIAPVRPGVGVRWQEQPDGALLANITTTAWHKPGLNPPRNVQWDLTVTTDPANAGAATAGTAGISAYAGDGVLGGAKVMASASRADSTFPNTGTVTIIDDNGKSDFMRYLYTARVLGLSEVYAGPWPGASILDPFPRDGGSTQFFQFSWTPPVDAWIFCNFHLGLVSKNDAAYHYIIPSLKCSPADQDGVTAISSYHTQNAAVNQYEDQSVSGIFRLAAHTNYLIRGAWNGGSGGSWSGYIGPNQSQLSAFAWQQ